MPTHRYRIKIAGGLGETGRDGTLNRILSLGFELVELSRLATARG